MVVLLRGKHVVQWKARPTRGAPSVPKQPCRSLFILTGPRARLPYITLSFTYFYILIYKKRLQRFYKMPSCRNYGTELKLFGDAAQGTCITELSICVCVVYQKVTNIHYLKNQIDKSFTTHAMQHEWNPSAQRRPFLMCKFHFSVCVWLRGTG